MKRRLPALILLSLLLVRAQTTAQLTWGGIDYRGNAWVQNVSRQWKAPQGLEGRHMALWASHGRYYDQEKDSWRWQRPRLFGTAEDLFTQSIVVPFLIPMLENAGAIVFTPRERDWQRHEAIVDNDLGLTPGTYMAQHGEYDWYTAEPGFSDLLDVYRDGDNPFLKGTYCLTDAQTSNRDLASITWQPELPEDGRYAVYVSYASLPTSVSDAHYTVRHGGVETHFRVNQRMGGGTWVYLGTFDFQKGNPDQNCVVLTNQSNYRGVVTADAVRFGGGMGNTVRGPIPTRSGMPRYLEGSRYYTQWAGMPYSVYGTKEGKNDYGEDINARSLMTNRLARGSLYLPGDSGLNVPIELCLAVHSDAGLFVNDSIVGTLGIVTTGPNTQLRPEDQDSLLALGLLPAGVSRETSTDLIDGLMANVTRDMTHLIHAPWTRREIRDRNYSETRIPQVPSAILETMSHQNFWDLRYGHDPWFKFMLARSIYKGLLRYVSGMHGRKNPIVQPLPPTHFAALLTAEGDSVRLSWAAHVDNQESTATPDSYILYTAIDDRSPDNGQRVYGAYATLPVNRGHLMRFTVTAVNEGGQSMPSEELCIYAPAARSASTPNVLIVNGFRRLAGPQPVLTDSLQGFDFNVDPGVVWGHSPCYTGRQQVFTTSTPASLGESGSEYERLLVAGNTFDYPTLHVRDLLAEGVTRACFSSCSSEALTGIDSSRFQMVDLILGAQRNDGYSLLSAPALTSELMAWLTRYKGSLLMSGAYLSEEIASDTYCMDFAAQTLHVAPAGACSLNDDNLVSGMGLTLGLYNDLNEKSFSTRRTSVLAPTADGAFTPLVYTDGLLSAAVAWQGEDRRTLTYGFPIEMIKDGTLRARLLAASIRYLLPQLP